MLTTRFRRERAKIPLNYWFPYRPCLTLAISVGTTVMRVPPGISVIATTISQASILPLALGIVDKFVLRPCRVHNLPTWVTLVTCLLSPLTAFSIRVLLGDLIIYVKAKRAGAVLPSHSPTWIPGAIHRIIMGLKAEETAYLGSMRINPNTTRTQSVFKVTPLKI